LVEKNQIFCSIQCKNAHHNFKNRLIYAAGKHGTEEIEEIQATVYNNDKKIELAARDMAAKKAGQDAIIEKLKTDYINLQKKYQNLEEQCTVLQSKYYRAYKSAKETEENYKLLQELAQQFKPFIEKISDNINIMDIFK
jgi:chromosome segregation ATPase